MRGILLNGDPGRLAAIAGAAAALTLAKTLAGFVAGLANRMNVRSSALAAHGFIDQDAASLWIGAGAASMALTPLATALAERACARLPQATPGGPPAPATAPPPTAAPGRARRAKTPPATGKKTPPPAP